MARRVITAREQLQMLSPWRTAGTYWHITDNPDFKPDPNFRPENNGTLGGHFSPGLFVSQNPEHWMQSYGYYRPYLSEIDVPDEVGEDFQNSPERFITPNQYDKIKIKRTIPLDAYTREQWGQSGPVESSLGEDFETGEKFTDYQPMSRDLYKKTPGYKYPGTAMDHPEEWRTTYEQRVRDYQQRTPGIIAGLSPWRTAAAHPSTYDKDHPLGKISLSHPYVDMHAWESPQGIKLNMIQVAPEHQNNGYAGAALRDLLNYADSRGVPVALTPGIPEGRKGMSAASLKKWYSSHGFVPNRGRNKDWNWAESMIRPARQEVRDA